LIDLAHVRRALTGHEPALATDLAPGRTPAAVAMVFRSAASGPEVLYIERAKVDGDPWSGHLAFPGGRLEPGDAGLRHAAERETAEEVGLDLSEAEYLGQLDDVAAASLTVCVSGFAYALTGPRPDLELNCEVTHAFWVPLNHLVDPARQRLESFSLHSGAQKRLPGIDLLGPGRPLLWGVTYRFTARALEVAGCPLPPVETLPPDRDSAAARAPFAPDE